MQLWLVDYASIGLSAILEGYTHIFCDHYEESKPIIPDIVIITCSGSYSYGSHMIPFHWIIL